MELSARLKKEAQRYNVPAQTLVMADLMVVGYTANEAYNIAYSENAALSKQQNISIRDNITFAVGFSDMLSERKRMLRGMETSTAADTSQQMTKDEVAAQLKAQIDLLPDGSKEKADVLMKYADLFAMKKEEKKADEEDIIRVWMPLTCDICPYKKSYGDAAGKGHNKSPEKKEG